MRRDSCNHYIVVKQVFYKAPPLNGRFFSGQFLIGMFTEGKIKGLGLASEVFDALEQNVSSGRDYRFGRRVFAEKSPMERFMIAKCGKRAYKAYCKWIAGEGKKPCCRYSIKRDCFVMDNYNYGDNRWR